MPGPARRNEDGGEKTRDRLKRITSFVQVILTGEAGSGRGKCCLRVRPHPWLDPTPSWGRGKHVSWEGFDQV